MSFTNDKPMIICDRCGEREEARRYSNGALMVPNYDWHTVGVDGEGYHLCPECFPKAKKKSSASTVTSWGCKR